MRIADNHAEMRPAAPRLVSERTTSIVRPLGSSVALIWVVAGTSEAKSTMMTLGPAGGRGQTGEVRDGGGEDRGPVARGQDARRAIAGPGGTPAAWRSGRERDRRAVHTPTARAGADGGRGHRRAGLDDFAGACRQVGAVDPRDDLAQVGGADDGVAETLD